MPSQRTSSMVMVSWPLSCAEASSVISLKGLDSLSVGISARQVFLHLAGTCFS
jgi:hypothetical protein